MQVFLINVTCFEVILLLNWTILSVKFLHYGGMRFYFTLITHDHCRVNKHKKSYRDGTTSLYLEG